MDEGDRFAVKITADRGQWEEWLRGLEFMLALQKALRLEPQHRLLMLAVHLRQALYVRTNDDEYSIAFY